MSPESWLRRYVAGEHEAVWAQILALGSEIRSDAHAEAAARGVAAETMRRVADNVRVLESRLRAIGYRFAADNDTEWPHRPLEPPERNVRKVLSAVETRIGGPFPISVIAFLTEVGYVDFNGELPGWQVTYTDGLQVITALDGLGDHLVDMQEQIGTAELELSADHLHKADISGGPPYGVRVPDGAVDAVWLNDDLHDRHTFVEYLRSVIADGGLPGWRRTPGETPPRELGDLTDGLASF